MKNIPVTNTGEFFESIKKLYLYFAGQQSNRFFECWELISEAWLATRGLNEKSEHIALSIWWAMRDYKTKRYKSHANQIRMKSYEITDLVLKRGKVSVILTEPVAPAEITFETVEQRVYELKKMRAMLETLPCRERDILTKRFGLNKKPPMTRSDCARIHGLTVERIRQIENKAIRRMTPAVLPGKTGRGGGGICKK